MFLPRIVVTRVLPHSHLLSNMNTKFLVLCIVALLGLTMVSAITSTTTLRRRVGLEQAPAMGEGEGAEDSSAGEGEAAEGAEGAESSAEGEGEGATELVGGEGCQDCNKKDAGAAVDEAVAPVADWLKSFRKRTGNSGDLYQIAEGM